MTLLPLFSSRPFPIEGLPLRGSQLFHHPYLFRILLPPSPSIPPPNLLSMHRVEPFIDHVVVNVIESRIIKWERKTYAMPRRSKNHQAALLRMYTYAQNLESIVNNIDIRGCCFNSCQIRPVSFSASPSFSSRIFWNIYGWIRTFAATVTIITPVSRLVSNSFAYYHTRPTYKQTLGIESPRLRNYRIPAALVDLLLFSDLFYLTIDRSIVRESDDADNGGCWKPGLV